MLLHRLSLTAKMPTGPRPSGTTRVYGYQRLISSAIGVGALIWIAAEVIPELTRPLPREHGPVALLIALLVLAFAIPIVVLIVSQRLGVRLSDEGVRNISVDTKSFTPWSDIAGFVVGPSPWLSNALSVYLVDRDGHRTALTRMGTWPFWRGRVQSECDALNRELEFERDRGVAPAQQRPSRPGQPSPSAGRPVT
jgi:hypothetical protein